MRMGADEKVKALTAALQSGDLELAGNLLADDFRLSGLTTRDLNKGEFLMLQSEFLAAMPDFSYNLSEVRQEHGRVVAWITITGTQTNDLALPMFGFPIIPATGLAISLPQTRVTYEVTDDHIRALEMEDLPGGGLSGLLQQIGAELPLQPRRDLPEQPSIGSVGS